MTDNPLDRAIDDVARRLTAQDPPADLRARVMARIHDRAQPRLVWRFAPLAAGVAGLAAIGFAWTVARTPHEAPRPAARSTISAAAPASSLPASQVADASAVIASARPAAVKTQAKPPVGPSAAELAWLARAVPALPQPAALNVEGIQPEALTIPQIDMKPLVTERLMPSPPDGGGAIR